MQPEKRGRTRVAGIGLTVVVLVGAAVGGMALGVASEAPAPLGAPAAQANGGAAAQASGPAAADAQAGPALVRFLHASPDTVAVNATVDDQTVLTNVSFGNLSKYLRVAPGEHTVTVSRYSDLTEGDVLFQAPIAVEADTNYTVAIAGESTTAGEGALRTVVLVENATTPAANGSTVRLTHLSPDAPAVDVTVAETGRTLFDDVSYLNSSPYATLPAGNYTLEVRRAAANDSGPVLATFNVSLSGGTAHEAYAVGYLDPEAAIQDTPFDLVVGEPNVSEPSPGTMITPTPEGTPTPANDTAG